MTMNIEQLKGVIAIEEEGTVSRAAKRLFISQSTLSNSIASLEQEIGFQIFERSHHGMYPTEKGRRLIYYARSILHFSDDIMSLSESGPQSVRFRLVAPRDERVNKAFTDFCSAHKDDAYIDISYTYASIGNAIEMIYRDLADYALLTVRRSDERLLAAECESRNLRLTKLTEVTMEVLFKADHPLRFAEDLGNALSSYPHIKNPDYFDLSFLFPVEKNKNSLPIQESRTISASDRDARLSLLSNGIGYTMGFLDKDTANRFGLASRSLPVPIDVYTLVSENKKNDATIREFQEILNRYVTVS